MAQSDNAVITEYVGSKKENDKFNSRWWTSKAQEQHKDVFATVTMIEEKQVYTRTKNIRHARLYSNLDVMGVYASVYAQGLTNNINSNRITLNVIKSCCDTVMSKIAKAKPRPLFLTEGGNWDLRSKAKNLTKFMDGAFDQMDIYQEKQKSFLDETVFGTGAVKFYKDKHKKMVCCERTMIDEIIVDDGEAIYGKPRSLYQARLVDKDLLKSTTDKKYWNDIDQASSGLSADIRSRANENLIRVIEAWHLPSHKGANDGAHGIYLDTCTILSEKWDKDYFPFVFDRWNYRLAGFWGMGIPEDISGIQVEINKILRNIQLSMHLFAIPRVWVENNSMVNIQGINNDLAMIGKYTGTAPQFHTPQAMSPDVYSHLWNLVENAFQQTGISMLSARSEKPAGLNSGTAQRVYQDIESDRFQIVGQQWEQSFVRAAYIVTDLTKDLAKELGEDLKVKVSDQGSMKTIRWSDVHMEEEKYLLRVFPSSILPTQPAAKMEKIVEYTQAEFFDKETAMDLMDFPDIEAATSKILAPRRIVFKILDKMMDKGVYESPEPFFNLDLTLPMAEQYYLDARVQDAPEDRLELIRRFMEDTKALIELRNQGMMAQQMAMLPPQAGGAMPPAQDPMAVPQAAPVSDILPI